MTAKWNAWVEEVTDTGVWFSGITEGGHQWHGLWPLSDVPENRRVQGMHCRMSGVRIIEWRDDKITKEDIEEAKRKAAMCKAFR